MSWWHMKVTVFTFAFLICKKIMGGILMKESVNLRHGYK